MNTELVTFPALDARTLAGTVYAPPSPRGALVLFPAIGVPQRFYGRFAAYFAERDWAVVTFDYRGVAASADRPLWREPARLLDWVKQDAAGAVDFALSRWPGLPLAGVGHSLGAQSFGLNPRARDLDRLVSIGAGFGDLTLYPAHLRRRYRLLLGTAVPLVATTLGWVPGKLGLGLDLPGGAVQDWARWCLTPGYAPAALGHAAVAFDAVTAPLLSVDLPDDDMAPPAAADALRAAYSRAQLRHRVVAASELPPNARGHFGAFRAGADPLWAEIDAFLKESPQKPG